MESNDKTIWIIDPAHSVINFKVRHLVISTVTGSFNKFEGSIETNSDDFSDSHVVFTAYTESVNTNMPDRDTHLRSAEFFDVSKYPKLHFVSKSFKKQSEQNFKMIGDITIRDVTREISLDVEYGGKMTDPWGKERAGFYLTGKINRKHFGLNWSVITEAGGAVAGDDVRLELDVEVIKQDEEFLSAIK